VKKRLKWQKSEYPKVISYARFFRDTLKVYSKALARNLMRPSIVGLLVSPYKGKAGPKRFTGTPYEVAEAFRNWQRDL